MVSYNEANIDINKLLGQRFTDLLKELDTGIGKSFSNNSYSFPNSQQMGLIDVPMGSFDVTLATAEKPVIGTSGLASCAGIAIYDFHAKIGGVAHVFFNSKVMDVIYFKDSQGRDIPSSGRALIIDNPFPFAPFTDLSLGLMAKADSVGGRVYDFYAFNVQHGCRTVYENKRLEQTVDATIATLRTHGKINSFEYRFDRAFVLDTRTGNIQGRE